MRCILAIVLPLLLAGAGAHAQNAMVTWSVFTTAFGEVSSDNARMLGMTGQPFAGEAGGGENFFSTGFLADPGVSGIVTAVSPGSPESLPASPEIFQNYPNPFNPTTKIGYRVSGPGSSWVKLSVYDILGREVAVLINEHKSAGEYEVKWDAANFPSGVYMYRLTAGDYVESKRMILLK
jgi:hypothetical protein